MNDAAIVKRSVRIAGHATSVSLEAAFWQGLCDIAASRRVSLNALLAAIDAARSGNLSSAIRLFVLDGARHGELTKPSADVNLGMDTEVESGSGCNLNRFRKARKREEARQQAAANRASFGRSKKQRLADDEERRRPERELDGKRLD